MVVFFGIVNTVLLCVVLTLKILNKCHDKKMEKYRKKAENSEELWVKDFCVDFTKDGAFFRRTTEDEFNKWHNQI